MIGLVHLVWAPLGPAPLREFLHSYRAHPAGAEHELIIVLNGAASTGSANSSAQDTSHTLLAELQGIEHRLIVLQRPVLDLPAYGLAAHQLQHERLCLLNSYATILADDWLARLAHAFDDPGVGLVGVNGSWESQAEWIRGKRRYWPYQLVGLRSARRDYPRFPNPHIRTAAFMLDRQLLLSMKLERATDKHATYLLESGWHSITRTVQGNGLRAVVVGRDGYAHDIEQWPTSATYRAGGQRNLLVADRRTRDWELASPRLRRRLTRDAWGSRSSGGAVVGETAPDCNRLERSVPVGAATSSGLSDRLRVPLGDLPARATAALAALRVKARRRRLAKRYLKGTGLEIGALHSPLYVPSGVTVRYVDRMDVAGLRSHYPELAASKLIEVDVVDDGETLALQADCSADFIIANHFIEHTEDPLGTLANHLRVLRPGGILYLAVPDRRRTFDSERQATPLEHLIRDHQEGPAWSRTIHQEEWARLVDKVPPAEVPARVQVLEEKDYSIHFHVWNPSEFVELLDYARTGAALPFEVESLQGNGHEFVAILRRV